MKFKPKTENELANLKDDDLIAYAVDARKAGDREAFSQAVMQFVAIRLGLISYWVGRKVSRDDAEDVVGDALASIIKGAGKVKGSNPGELVEWMRTITERRIADYYRAREKSPGTVPIEDQPGDDDEWQEPTGGKPDDTGGVDARMVMEELLDRLDPVKREVVELKIAGYSSKEIVERSSDAKMTTANVDKIFSRFRKDFADAYWGS